MVADMKIDPRLELFSLWGKPIIDDGAVFPLPRLPERRKEEQKKERLRGKSGSSRKLLETRGGESEFGKRKWKGKGESRGARRDGCGLAKYIELPSVAAHRPWCARNDSRGESGHRERRLELATYRELPSVAAHSPWCARNDASAENGDPEEGNGFDRYRELPSVAAHGAWCPRTGSGDEGGGENGWSEEGYRFEKYRELPSVLTHGAWYTRSEEGNEKEVEEAVVEEED